MGRKKVERKEGRQAERHAGRERDAPWRLSNPRRTRRISPSYVARDGVAGDDGGVAMSAPRTLSRTRMSRARGVHLKTFTTPSRRLCPV